MTAKLLRLACVLEILTAFALIVAPAALAWLILGDRATGTGAALGRLAGFALLSLGVACYPRSLTSDHLDQAVLGMLTYNALVTIYLIYWAISGGAIGVALWPVAALHAVFTILFAQAWFKERLPNSLSS